MAIALTIVSIFLASSFNVGLSAYKNIPELFRICSFVYNLPFFCFGIVAFHAFRTLRSGSIEWGLWLTAIAIAIVVMIVNWYPLASNFLSPYIIASVSPVIFGIPFGIICVGLALNPTPIISNVITQFLGRISYSLYLAHPLLVYYLSEYGCYRQLGNILWAGGVVHLLACIAVTLAVLVPMRSREYTLGGAG